MAPQHPYMAAGIVTAALHGNVPRRQSAHRKPPLGGARQEMKIPALWGGDQGSGSAQNRFGSGPPAGPLGPVRVGRGEHHGDRFGLGGGRSLGFGGHALGRGPVLDGSGAWGEDGLGGRFAARFRAPGFGGGARRRLGGQFERRLGRDIAGCREGLVRLAIGAVAPLEAFLPAAAAAAATAPATTATVAVVVRAAFIAASCLAKSCLDGFAVRFAVAGGSGLGGLALVLVLLVLLVGFR